MRSPYTAAEVAAYYSVRVPHLRQRGAEWRGPCPIHRGKDDNFAVEAATGQWYCHSQCGRGGSLIDLEMELSGADFQHATAELDRIVGRISTNPRIVNTYDYQDAEGALLFQVVRYEPKDFRQRRPDGRGGWLWKTKGVRQVLYRLPQLQDADNVLVVEGEKDVQSLERLGFTATCNPGGADKWRPGFSKSLKGKRVVILPDNDRPGQEHARQVAEGVLPYAREVRIVTVSTGKDATDWINGGATREVIEAAIAAAPVVQTSDVGRSGNSASRTTESTQNLPEIIVTNRQLRDSRRECLAALQAGNDPPFLFVRDGRLVAIRIDETGRYVIHELSDVQLRGHLTNPRIALHPHRIGAQELPAAALRREAISSTLPIWRRGSMASRLSPRSPYCGQTARSSISLAMTRQPSSTMRRSRAWSSRRCLRTQLLLMSKRQWPSSTRRSAISPSSTT